MVSDLDPGGNLYERILAAAVRRLAHRNLNDIPVDEVADDAGVDRDAAHKLFPNGAALIKAIAEHGLIRMTDVCTRAVTQIPLDDPMGQIEALGKAYITWAINNPLHFRLISSRTLVPVAGMDMVDRYNYAMYELLMKMYARAQAHGQIPANADLGTLALSGRAFIYGIVNMMIDGHIESWLAPGESTEDAVERMLTHYGLCVYGVDRNARS